MDSPLTPLGQTQAKATGEFFRAKNIKFEKAFCSTQERASDTLELITQKQLEYTRLKDLREKWYGIYEGQDEITLPWNHGANHDPVMEEDFLAIDRMKRAMNYILSQLNDDATALIVGHGAILGLYVRDLFPESQFHFENCAIAKLVFNGEKAELAGKYWPAKKVK
ncbi:phosphoglycerate mutase [Lactobacillus psittaci DSM 15354]|uniref:Phosphoglycerate mutase n=1 Tax=Lactobacillus psittaci DSM 15354 TaxID=1122152 RepID=A0A0R1RXQ3_9LACO|nr:phosphoglycerate mutase [Lactobacillus psittaci DSM 15354]